MYSTPSIETTKVTLKTQVLAISGPENLVEGGENDGTHKPRAPKAF